MSTRHRLSPTDKLNCPPCHGGLRVLATMQQAVRDDGDRVGMDDTKTRKSGRKTLSSSRTAPLKPKPGLSGPPVEIEVEKLPTQTKLRFHFPICTQPSRFFWGMGSGFFTASKCREGWGIPCASCASEIKSRVPHPFRALCEKGGIPQPARAWDFPSVTTFLFHHIFLVRPSQTPNRNRARIPESAPSRTVPVLQRRTHHPPQNHF